MTHTDVPESSAVSPDQGHPWEAAVNGSDPRATGVHLRQARAAARLLQATAAAALGVSASTYSKLESGERWLRPTELFTLARLYHTDPLALLMPLPHETRLTDAVRPSTAEPERQAIRMLEQLATIGLALRIRHGYRHVPQPVSGEVAYHYDPDRDARHQGERAAHTERRRLNLHGPLQDLSALTERHHGLQLYSQDLGPTTEPRRELIGVGRQHALLGRCLILNTRASQPVRNYMLAMSLGSFLLFPERTQVWQMIPATQRTPGTPEQQQHAACVQGFAQELALPSKDMLWAIRDMRAEHRAAGVSTRDLSLLARRYQVPLHLLLTRLASTGLITAAEQQTVIAERGHGTPEEERLATSPGPVQYPDAHWQAAVHLLLNGEINREQLLSRTLPGVTSDALSARVKAITEFTPLDPDRRVIISSLAEEPAPLPLHLN